MELIKKVHKKVFFATNLLDNNKSLKLFTPKKVFTPFTLFYNTCPELFDKP